MNPDKQNWKYQHDWIPLNLNELTLDSVWMGFGWNNNLHPQQFYTVLYFWLTSAYSPELGWRNPCWAGVHHVGGHIALMWQTWMSDLWHFYSWWTWCHLTFGKSEGKCRKIQVQCLSASLMQMGNFILQADIALFM